MFKKFYILLIFSSIFVSFIGSFSTSLDQTSYIYPTYITNISSYFGYRDLFGTKNFHNGIDFPAPENTKVYSTLPGLVTFCGFTSGYGICVIILNDNCTKTLYGHLSENIIVNVGDKISHGELIGYIGPKVLSNGKLNGWTTGPHLHFTIYNADGIAIDPLEFEFKKKEDIISK